MNLDPSAQDAISNDAGANWCEGNAPYGAGDLGSPGLENPPCGGIDPPVGVTHFVDIEGFAFNPDPMVIKAGDTVVWTNKDDFPHTATADDFSWTTPFLGPGESAEILFTEPGIHPYHCDVHTMMKANLFVE